MICYKCKQKFDKEKLNKSGNFYTCNSCQKKLFRSKEETEINDFVISLGYETILNKRHPVGIGRSCYELDVFIPSKNIAFEYNGSNCHNDLFKDPNYHYEKENFLKVKGLEFYKLLISIGKIKNDIVKSIIKNSLGRCEKIYARKCLIVEISNEEAKVFLTYNHLQGYVNCKKFIGLKFNNELVSLIGISTNRFKNNEKEIVRFCNKLNYNVIGGFKKLLNEVIRSLNLNDKLVSYVDLMYFTGNGYDERFKKEFVGIGYRYYKDNQLFSRFKFQKHKLKDLLVVFDNNLSEKENMISNGYSRLYDAGVLKFTYTKI